MLSHITLHANDVRFKSIENCNIGFLQFYVNFKSFTNAAYEKRWNTIRMLTMNWTKNIKMEAGSKKVGGREIKWRAVKCNSQMCIRQNDDEHWKKLIFLCVCRIHVELYFRFQSKIDDIRNNIFNLIWNVELLSHAIGIYIHFSK